MTYYERDRVYNRDPMLVCDRCGDFVDLSTKELVAECKVNWKTVSNGTRNTHFCPKCKDIPLAR